MAAILASFNARADQLQDYVERHLPEDLPPIPDLSLSQILARCVFGIDIFGALLGGHLAITTLGYAMGWTQINPIRSVLFQQPCAAHLSEFSSLETLGHWVVHLTPMLISTCICDSLCRLLLQHKILNEMSRRPPTKEHPEPYPPWIDSKRSKILRVGLASFAAYQVIKLGTFSITAAGKELATIAHFPNGVIRLASFVGISSLQESLEKNPLSKSHLKCMYAIHFLVCGFLASRPFSDCYSL